MFFYIVRITKILSVWAHVIIDICSPHVSTQVKGLIQKVHSSHPPLNDSLDGEIQAFLTDEDQLHTHDDLTKVSPVTPTTGTIIRLIGFCSAFFPFIKIKTPGMIDA